MENIDRKFKEASEEDLDSILDAALAKYASAEPRPGLEERILASFRSNATPRGQYAWWPWRSAAALAAVLVALVIGLRSTKPDSELARHPTRVQRRSSEAELHGLGPDVDVPKRQAPIDISGASSITIHRKPRVPKNPKLDQFPSPQPLTAEEIALAQYAKNFPKEARLVAQAQEEFALEAEKQLNDVLETRLSASTQHER